MEPIQISWIVAVVAGSVVAKFLGLIVKKRDPGAIVGPLVGILGGVLLWQGVVYSGIVEEINYVMAGVLSVAGASTSYMLITLLRSKR